MQVHLGAVDPDVAEVRRQQGQLRVEILAFPVPRQQAQDSEGVPQVVEPRPLTPPTMADPGHLERLPKGLVQARLAGRPAPVRAREEGVAGDPLGDPLRQLGSVRPEARGELPGDWDVSRLPELAAANDDDVGVQIHVGVAQRPQLVAAQPREEQGPERHPLDEATMRGVVGVAQEGGGVEEQLDLGDREHTDGRASSPHVEVPRWSNEGGWVVGHDEAAKLPKQGHRVRAARHGPCEHEGADDLLVERDGLRRLGGNEAVETSQLLHLALVLVAEAALVLDERGQLRGEAALEYAHDATSTGSRATDRSDSRSTWAYRRVVLDET